MVHETSLSLIRLIAASQRSLDKDMDLSPLQAIDRLQKLYARFKENWIATPWIVLPVLPAVDPRPYVIPATMPVPDMLEAIKKHGEPCGIVGLALLDDGTTRVLKINFKKDAKSRKFVEQSANYAWERYQKLAREINGIFQTEN